MVYGRLLALILFLLPVCTQAKLVILSDDPIDTTITTQVGHKDIASDSYKLLFESLKELDIHIEIAPLGRINTLLNSQEPICAINRIKTKERELYNLYSLPVHLYPSHRLYYFKNQVSLPPNLLNHHNELTSLNDLLRHFQHKTIAHETNKSYGPLLDQHFALVNEEQIIRRAGGDAYKAMVAMFERHRVDFLVSYPAVFKAYSVPSTANDVASIAIANQPSFIAGHIACSQNTESELIIKRINQVLLKLYPTAEYLALHLVHVPESEHELLTRRIADLYLHNQINE